MCSVYVWTERVAALVDDSLWIDALAVSLEHYETTVAAFREAVDAAEKKAKALAAASPRDSTLCTLSWSCGWLLSNRTGYFSAR